MRIRMVRCPEDAHKLPWVPAEECGHVDPARCPKAKKAKKPRHKLQRSPRGYLVAITGIPPEGWPYDYDPPDWALELSEPKRYRGKWVPTLDDVGYHGTGSRLVPPAESALITCTACGLVGAD